MNPEYFKSTDYLKDYIKQSEKLSPFYKQPLYPDWSKLAKEVSTHFKQSAAVDELISQNTSSKDQQALKNCSLLKQKNTVCVVTGQQLGLMISPLYIIYKTISTLLLSERLNREIEGFNFVPVFWLEGEDHDFAEVKSLNVFDKTGSMLNLSLTEEEINKGLPLNKRQIDNEITSIISELKENLQPTEFSPYLFERLTTIYQAGTNWLDAFKQHISFLFAGSGLLYFNAGSARIKELSRPFFKQALVKNRELVLGFKSKSLELQNAGYKNQVSIQEDRSYLFLNKNGPRQSLLINGEGFSLKDAQEKFSLQEILHLLEGNPQYFSSTVLTRPLWQSWLLPTVSYVAGAAEIAYWGQLMNGFNNLDLIMPHIQPRHSLTIIEPKIDRLASKYENNLLNVDSDKSKFLKEYFINNQLGEINTVLAEFEEQVSKNKKKVKELIQRVDPTLLDPVEKSYSAISGTINKLQDRLSNRVKEKETTIQNHLNNIHDALMPNGNLQERVLSSVYFENKYGSDWVLKIKEQISDNFEEHLIVKI